MCWRMRSVGLEKTREFQSFQSKHRKMCMRKTHKTQGEPCILGFSEQNATLKKRLNFRVFIVSGILREREWDLWPWNLVHLCIQPSYNFCVHSVWINA